MIAPLLLALVLVFLAGCPRSSFTIESYGGSGAGSSTKLVDGRHYEERTAGDHPRAIDADFVEKGAWRLTRFERDGHAVSPTALDLGHLSLQLDAEIVRAQPDGTDARFEHPLRRDFRDLHASGKRADWRALLPRIEATDCNVPEARGRFLDALAKDSALDKDGAIAVHAAACGEPSGAADPAIERLLARGDTTEGMRAATIDAARTRAFDDGRQTLLLAAYGRGLPAGQRAAYLEAALGLSFDDGKVQCLAPYAEGEALTSAEQEALASGVVARLSFDDGKQRLLERLAANPALTAEGATAALRAAGKLSFDDGRVAVAKAFISRDRPGTALTAIELAKKLSFDDGKKKVLLDAIGRQPSDAVRIAAADAATGMSFDEPKVDVLVAIASTAMPGPVTDRVRAAAKKLSFPESQVKVLEALRR